MPGHVAESPFLVDLAWSVCLTLIQEWQVNPGRWEAEIDFQCELMGRLSSINSSLGSSTIKSQRGEHLARVVAEPTIYYRNDDAKDSWCKPDVAIRKEQVAGNYEVSRWPMLWACEIKYHPYVDSNDDEVKLRHLLNQSLADNACWIRLWRDPQNGQLTCKEETPDGRLRIYEARPFPAAPTGNMTSSSRSHELKADSAPDEHTCPH